MVQKESETLDIRNVQASSLVELQNMEIKVKDESMYRFNQMRRKNQSPICLKRVLFWNSLLWSWRGNTSSNSDRLMVRGLVGGGGVE